MAKKQLSECEKAIIMQIKTINYALKNADKYTTLDLIDKIRTVQDLGLGLEGATKESDYDLRLNLDGRISLLEDVITDRIYQ